jgi:hypothetical protein
MIASRIIMALDAATLTYLDTILRISVIVNAAIGAS